MYKNINKKKRNDVERRDFILYIIGVITKQSSFIILFISIINNINFVPFFSCNELIDREIMQSI